MTSKRLRIAPERVDGKRPTSAPGPVGCRRACEGSQGVGKVLEVPGETPVSAEPGEGALDHSAARLDDEAFMSSLCLTISMRTCGRFTTAASLPSVVAATGPDQLEPGEAPAYLVEYAKKVLPRYSYNLLIRLAARAHQPYGGRPGSAVRIPRSLIKALAGVSWLRQRRAAGRLRRRPAAVSRPARRCRCRR